MQTQKISAQEALDLIKKRRPQIYPNEGFREQLDLFFELGYNVTPENPLYRRFLVDRSVKSLGAGNSIEGIIRASDPSSAKATSTIGSSGGGGGLRRVLAKDENIIRHTPGAGQQDFSHKKRDRTRVPTKPGVLVHIY
ncbi:tyrosine protein phosphatase yvh1 [Spiromyces aspiralis]|uniref:Tyrosine protein phosphatase yvh1 n=1 Tax=Spiromyces aspiralis TaxID=68401 RepID=A0ACC1HC22_9FUNG|nr:tyrosine protein phosphatase yvh1 [Spiromyces aspiralis]